MVVEIKLYSSCFVYCNTGACQKSTIYLEYILKFEISSMSKTKINFTPWGILGVIVVLGLLWFYPKVNPKSKVANPTTKVTVTNEFSQPEQPFLAVTAEEKQAQQTFFLKIVNPIDQTTFKTNTITVSGKTVPLADVFVNEIDTKADASGNFRVSYSLELGDNYLIVGANDEFGNFKEYELMVYLAE